MNKLIQVFTVVLPVRIDAINYGGHLAHDKLVTMMHEARLQFLANIGQTEISFYGYSLIMNKLEVDYKNQSFHGDELVFDLSISDVSRVGFTINYHIYKNLKDDDKLVIAEASTQITCFDYNSKKVRRLPVEAIIVFEKFS